MVANAAEAKLGWNRSILEIKKKKKNLSLCAQSVRKNGQKWATLKEETSASPSKTTASSGAFTLKSTKWIFLFLNVDGHRSSHHAGCPSLTGASSLRTLTCVA